MVWLKRTVGLLAAVLGIAGVAACLFGIASVWSIRSRVDDVVAGISVRIDDAFASVEKRAHQATEFINSAQNSARELNERVQQRVSELRDVPLEEAADIDQIERQLYARIQLATDWIGLVQSTTDLVGQLLEVFESASLFAKKESRTTEELIVALRAGRDETQQMSEFVEEIKDSLAEIREHRNVEDNARQITTLSSVIHTSLVKIEQHARDFGGGVVEARADVTSLTARIRRQIVVAAVIVTFVLVWLAVAQLSLAIHGWRLLRSAH